jgi:hypothetical protein
LPIYLSFDYYHIIDRVNAVTRIVRAKFSKTPDSSIDCLCIGVWPGVTTTMRVVGSIVVVLLVWCVCLSTCVQRPQRIVCIAREGSLLVVGDDSYSQVHFFEDGIIKQSVSGPFVNLKKDSNSFGIAVSIGARTVAVGAPGERDPDPWRKPFTGCVHLYQFDDVVHQLVPRSHIAPASQVCYTGKVANANFGSAVSLSPDGHWLAVGAMYDDVKKGQWPAGAVYLYERNPNSTSVSFVYRQTLRGEKPRDSLGGALRFFNETEFELRVHSNSAGNSNVQFSSISPLTISLCSERLSLAAKRNQAMGTRYAVTEIQCLIWGIEFNIWSCG